MWYNVIVQKQTPQEHYTAYQLKLPVEIEKIIEQKSEWIQKSIEKENKKILTQAFRMLLKIPTKKQL